MSQGLISLIPKPGKDLLSFNNWRPIILIRNDAKLLALISAHRLKLCLHEVIDHCHSGFMSGRHISNNIRLVLDLIDYNKFLDKQQFHIVCGFLQSF